MVLNKILIDEFFETLILTNQLDNKMVLDVSVVNFVTIGLMALVFILIFKFASKKAGINTGV